MTTRRLDPGQCGHAVWMHACGLALTLLTLLTSMTPQAGGAAIHRVARAAEKTRDRLSQPAITLDSLAATADLGHASSFRQTNGDLISSPKGVKRCRLTQTYAGYDVYGASVEAEMDLHGNLTGHYYGHVAHNLEQDIPDPEACTQSFLAMANIAIINEGFTAFDQNIDVQEVERIVYVDRAATRARLAYLVKFFYITDYYVSLPVYVIDACTTEIITNYNQIENSSSVSNVDEGTAEEEAPDGIPVDTEKDKQTTTIDDTCEMTVVGFGGNQKTGRTTYNKPPRCLLATKDGNYCIMLNRYVSVYNNHGTKVKDSTDLVSFPCDQGYNDTVNGAYGVANDAFSFGTVVGRLFEELYGLQLTPFRLVVHYGANYENAFWNGEDLFFGDGHQRFYPLVSQDVTAHELAHGVTYRASRLQYSKQAGGINEAFSDMTGEVAERFGTGTNDWKIGDDIVKGHRALRYMDDPAQDGRSLKHVQDMGPYTQVHQSSGIFNHAFYLLVEREKMPIFDAYKCFLDANLLIWDSTTNFEDGACAVVQTCEDNGFQWQKVVKVFQQVGIHFKDCQFMALNPILYVGDTRQMIMISRLRNPTFTLDLTDDPPSAINVRAVANVDFSVKISISVDQDGKGIIVKGRNHVIIQPKHMPPVVYITLSVRSTVDVLVDLSIS